MHYKPTPTYDRPNSLWLTSLLMMTQSFLSCRRSVRRGRPCSVSQLLTTQLASTHLFFHYSLAEPLSQPANMFPRDLDVCFCVILHCAVTKRKSTLLTTHTHHTNGSGEDRPSQRKAKQPNPILHPGTGLICVRA